MVRVAHASIDERGRASGGQAGDQTGKEVCIRGWYPGGRNVVLRPTRQKVGEKMASSAAVLCNGGLVGYDQWNRNSLWDKLGLVGWKPETITDPCATDCSAFVAACARCAGVSVPRVALGGGKFNAPVTWTMRAAFVQTGEFTALTGQKYLGSDKHLEIGDVLLRESGHTAMVLDDGPEARFYTVQPGDSIWAISYNHGVSMDDLIEANGLPSIFSVIHPGDRLRIPPRKVG